MDIINSNQGVISLCGIIVGVIMTFIGISINKKLLKLIQLQSLGNNSKGLQAANDIYDRSIMVTGGDKSANSVGGNAYNSD